MKATELVSQLNHAIEVHGTDVDVVFQDSPPNTHPDCCKHEQFFAVEEAKKGGPETGIEVVIRTWPY